MAKNIKKRDFWNKNCQVLQAIYWTNIFCLCPVFLFYMIEDYAHEKLAFVSDPTTTTTTTVGLLIKGFIYQNEQVHSLQSCKIWILDTSKRHQFNTLTITPGSFYFKNRVFWCFWPFIALLEGGVDDERSEESWSYNDKFIKVATLNIGSSKFGARGCIAPEAIV